MRFALEDKTNAAQRAAAAGQDWGSLGPSGAEQASLEVRILGGQLCALRPKASKFWVPSATQTSIS